MVEVDGGYEDVGRRRAVRSEERGEAEGQRTGVVVGSPSQRRAAMQSRGRDESPSRLGAMIRCVVGSRGADVVQGRKRADAGWGFPRRRGHRQALVISMIIAPSASSRETE